MTEATHMDQPAECELLLVAAQGTNPSYRDKRTGEEVMKRSKRFPGLDKVRFLVCKQRDFNFAIVFLVLNRPLPRCVISL